MTDNTGSELRILGIFAHPDDAEFTCAGSSALWAGQGAEITYVVVTAGGAGSNDPNQNLDDLVRIREVNRRPPARCWACGKFSFSAIRMGPRAHA